MSFDYAAIDGRVVTLKPLDTVTTAAQMTNPRGSWTARPND